MVGFWTRPSSRLQSANFFLCPHMVEGTGEPYRVSFVRALIPLVTVLPSWLKHLPKAPLPIAITLGISFNIWIVGGHEYSNRSTRWMLIFKYQNLVNRDFPGSPVGKTLCFHCRGPHVRSLVWLTDPASMPQLRSPPAATKGLNAATKIPRAATKTWRSQNK